MWWDGHWRAGAGAGVCGLWPCGRGWLERLRCRGVVCEQTCALGGDAAVIHRIREPGEPGGARGSQGEPGRRSMPSSAILHACLPCLPALPGNPQPAQVVLRTVTPTGRRRRRRWPCGVPGLSPRLLPPLQHPRLAHGAQGRAAGGTTGADGCGAAFGVTHHTWLGRAAVLRQCCVGKVCGGEACCSCTGFVPSCAAPPPSCLPPPPNI